MRTRLPLSVLALLAACSPPGPARDASLDAPFADASDPPEDAPPDAPPREYPMPAAANAVSRADPRWEGQYRFLYDAWGTEVLGDWPPAEFMVRLQRDEPTVFGNQFEAFGFVPDPNDDLPVGFKRGRVDPIRVHETCALCHVGRLADGRTWFGLPNGRLDFGRFRVEVSRRWVAAGNAPLMTPLQERKALQLGPGRTNAETANYPVEVPADFPAYFTLARRGALNYMGTGRNLRTEAYLAIFTFGAGSPNDRTARVPFPAEPQLTAFLAFLGTLEAPSPPAADPTLLARGQAVFERARCGHCHHVGAVEADGVTTLDRSPDGRERLPGEDPRFARGSIRTSPQHRVLQDGDPSVDAGVDEGFGDLIQFIFARRLQVQATDGYRVNDLRGLAYTAPYLHNGSVPTLEDLLRPRAERPATFQREGFTVDTTRPPNSNQGHEFGVELPADDRAALVAYLRSL